MKVALVLSGCGFLDGSEIHEAVLLLLALERAGAEVECHAPDVLQRDVVDHAARRPEDGRRSVLLESARIARGRIRPLHQLDLARHDALAFPGGYGAAKNLCDFAVAGADARVEPATLRAIQGFHAARKPILALCIAPALVAAALRGKGVRLTIGEDAATAAALEAMGARHEPRKVHECCVDAEQLVVSAPAYMFDASILEVARGIDSAVFELGRLVKRI
jgi:enhancing lycopene biosynthesis protein 2